MIRLDVKDYCHNCRDFEPVADRINYLNKSVTVVRCEFRDKCAVIEQYLKAKEEESAE
jgi:hypothetical protein